MPNLPVPENEVGPDISAAMLKVMRALLKRPNQSILRLAYSTRLTPHTVKMIVRTLESARIVKSKPLTGRDAYWLSSHGEDTLEKATLANSIASLADSLTQRTVPGLLGGLAQLDVHDRTNVRTQEPPAEASQGSIAMEPIDMGNASHRGRAKVTCG